ncbi:MAG: YfhO family protein [Anaerolineae bacterium]|nr:YfhO family protein [Anaerolineae bacterium]
MLLCLLLMLPLAAPLWTHLPLAKFIAFPWRLLGPAGLLAALLGGVPLLLLPERPAFGGLLAVLVIAPLSVAPYLFPAASLWRPVPAEGITLADIGRYEVSGGSRGTASANEYLPRWVEDGDPPLDLLGAYEAGRLPERLDTAGLPPGTTFETIRSAPLETIHRLTLPQAAPVTLLRFYYPGWRAFVDGQPVDARPASPSGFIAVDVPAGEHTLRIAWGQTPPRIAGFALFGLGIVGLLAMLIFGARSEKAAAPDERAAPEPHGTLWLAAAGFVLLLTGAKALWIEPATSWFRLASPPDAPAGMTHALNLRYDNGVELMGYDLRSDEARQGGELRLRLFWRATRPLTDDVRSFAHLDAPVTGITWANQTKDQPGEMPSRYWPPGYYVVDDFRLRIPAETPPVSADLTVGLLTRDAESIALPDGRKQVALGQITIRPGRQPFAQRPAAETHRLGEAITLEGYRAEVSERNGEPEVALTLDWKTDRQLDADYTVFAQVFDAGGQMVGQLDGPACEGSCPSSRWTPGGTVEDARQIPLREGTSPEGLRVVAGLYDPATGERLPVRDARGAELPDRAIQIEVAPTRER